MLVVSMCIDRSSVSFIDIKFIFIAVLRKMYCRWIMQFHCEVFSVFEILLADFKSAQPFEERDKNHSPRWVHQSFLHSIKNFKENPLNRVKYGKTDARTSLTSYATVDCFDRRVRPHQRNNVFIGHWTSRLSCVTWATSLNWLRRELRY